MHIQTLNSLIFQATEQDDLTSLLIHLREQAMDNEAAGRLGVANDYRKMGKLLIRVEHYLEPLSPLPYEEDGDGDMSGSWNHDRVGAALANSFENSTDWQG